MKNMICQQLKKYSGEVNLLGDNNKTKLLQVMNTPSLYVYVVWKVGYIGEIE